MFQAMEIEEWRMTTEEGSALEYEESGHKKNIFFVVIVHFAASLKFIVVLFVVLWHTI